MSEFARQVVREEVDLASFTPTVAVQKRREKSVGTILGAQVYCHFEADGRRLRCAFSNERKYLLGETVRDWLGHAHGARDFLWCERLDDELALVVVADGRVVKDVAEVQNTDRDVATALGRLPPNTPVFLHPGVAHELLDKHPGARPLATSVRDHIARRRAQRQAVAELGPVTDIPAVRRWNAFWKWTRVVALTVAAVALVAFAWVYWRGEDGTSVEAAEETRVRSLTEYDRLLAAPDVGAVLGQIHEAYRRYLADPFFGGSWNAQRITWRRGTQDQVAITAQLPHKLPADAKSAPTPEDDVQYGVPREELAALERAVVAYAERVNWRVDVDRLRATVHLPIVATPRDPAAGERNRLRRPSDERGRTGSWHLRSMRRDLEAFGTLGPFAAPARRRGGTAPTSYEADRFKLELKGLEWAYPDAVGWLGKRLSGGPVVLDELALERAPDPAESGGRRGWTGAIVFRTVWCKNDGVVNSCVRPVPPPTDAAGNGSRPAEVP